MKRYVLYFIAILLAGFTFACEFYAFYDHSFFYYRYIPMALCIGLLVYFCLQQKTLMQWIILGFLFCCIPAYLYYLNFQEGKLNYLLYEKPCKYRGYFSHKFTTVEILLYRDNTFTAYETDYIKPAKRYMGEYAIASSDLELKYRLFEPGAGSRLADQYHVDTSFLAPKNGSHGVTLQFSKQ